MDYEKKYKDAQKWIESIYPELSHEQQMEAEAFFPELAESKDERIRKALIEYFRWNMQQLLNDFSNRDVLTWLEKQGEQKQYDIDILEKHITKDYISELAHTVIVRNGWEIIDAKEQKPIELSECDRILQDSSISYLCNLRDTFETKGWNKKQIQKCINWLKSLKPQPKQEWSEEDENTIKVLMNIIRKSEMIDSIIYTDSLKEKLYDWLKSLKDRITWKPSEMQIQCLYDAIEHYQTNGYPASKLNELYEQMSKIYKL